MRHFNEARRVRKRHEVRYISLLASSLSPKPLFEDGTSLADTNHSRLRSRSRLSEDITFFISALGLAFQKSGGHFQQPGRWRSDFMPMYDYKCLDCGKESLVVLTLKEHEATKVTCPKCGSSKMKQLYTSFVAHTTKKS